VHGDDGLHIVGYYASVERMVCADTSPTMPRARVLALVGTPADAGGAKRRGSERHFGTGRIQECGVPESFRVGRRDLELREMIAAGT